MKLISVLLWLSLLWLLCADIFAAGMLWRDPDFTRQPLAMFVFFGCCMMTIPLTAVLEHSLGAWDVE